jgi:hypothetical protein
MSQPSDFDPYQPPPVQQPAQPEGTAPQEVDFGHVAPPPQDDPTRPATMYIPQGAALPAKKSFNPVAFILGLIGTAILGVAGMLPLISPAAPAKVVGQDEEGVAVLEKTALVPSKESKVLFDALGPEYLVRFDPKFYFMWAAFIMALATLWLTLIRSWIAFWIIGVGTLATAAILYVLILRTTQPGVGLPAFGVGALVILLAAIIGTRSTKTARYQY